MLIYAVEVLPCNFLREEKIYLFKILVTMAEKMIAGPRR